MVFGHRAAVATGVTVYTDDLGDMAAVGRILREEKIEVVMHFAAFTYVGESVQNPLKYYRNNLVATISLLEAMVDAGVNRFIFSSTCATYGEPQYLPLDERHPQAPINPYGQTKLDVENLLKALSRAHGLSFASFRYFNAAGAATDGSIGEDHSPETHLLPLLFEVALGQRESIQIFGTDYETPDGTCLRDYVHVDDLSRAHILSIPRLGKSGTQLYYNLGTGKPCSVREAIRAVEEITGKTIPTIEAPRRPGDPPALYADSTKAINELGWKIEFPTIDSIAQTAWQWHKDHPHGFDCPG
jgi:UDP-glucose 4-epimerase